MTEPVVTLAGRLSPRSGWEATNCAIARAMDVLGNRTIFLLLREAFYGTTRFDDFAERVGVSESVAAARLRELVEAGLLERRPYQQPGERTRHGYHLTQAGVDFFPVLVALWQWGQRWLGPSGIEMTHRGCGADVRADLYCAHGHPLQVTDVEMVTRRAR